MKKLVGMFFALFIICSISVISYAEDWTVIFLPNNTMGGTLRDNYQEINDIVSGMEPGDSHVFTITLINQNPTATRWYMKNQVLKTLETSATSGFSIAGGAYSYKLSFVGPSRSETFFDSDRVGGDMSSVSTDTKYSEGLEEATEGLDDYFYLDRLNYGQSATVTLEVALEGETQGNDYQNTVAKIMMQFAVELVNGSNTAVKTGDENNLLPYYIVMVIAGLLFLYLALDAYTDKLYKKGKA